MLSASTPVLAADLNIWSAAVERMPVIVLQQFNFYMFLQKLWQTVMACCKKTKSYQLKPSLKQLCT